MIHALICFTNWVTEEPLRLTRKQNQTPKPKSTVHVIPCLGEGRLERQGSALGILLRPQRPRGPAPRETRRPVPRGRRLAWELSSRAGAPGDHWETQEPASPSRSRPWTPHPDPPARPEAGQARLAPGAICPLHSG